MRHILAIYGKMKGHGKCRKNVPEYIGPCPEEAAVNVKKWFVEKFKKLGPYNPEDKKNA